MPTTPLRPCPGCGTLVSVGRCPACSRHLEQRRGTSTQRGYGHAWTRFRNVTFPALLAQAGRVPICGAALPTGPKMAYSRCKQAGLFVDTDLHLDHEPPLQDWERGTIQLINDPARVGYLCASCHSLKTSREQHSQPTHALDASSKISSDHPGGESNSWV